MSAVTSFPGSTLGNSYLACSSKAVRKRFLRKLGAGQFLLLTEELVRCDQLTSVDFAIIYGAIQRELSPNQLRQVGSIVKHVGVKGMDEAQRAAYISEFPPQLCEAVRLRLLQHKVRKGSPQFPTVTKKKKNKKRNNLVRQTPSSTRRVSRKAKDYPKPEWRIYAHLGVVMLILIPIIMIDKMTEGSYWVMDKSGEFTLGAKVIFGFWVVLCIVVNVIYEAADAAWLRSLPPKLRSRIIHEREEERIAWEQHAKEQEKEAEERRRREWRPQQRLPEPRTTGCGR